MGWKEDDGCNMHICGRGGRMIRLIFILLFAWSSMPVLLAQSGEQSQRVSSCRFKEIVDPRGWTIPGLSKTKTKLAHARYTSEGTPPDVFVDLLQPISPANSVFLVSRQSADRLEVRNQPADVSSISCFTMNGHAFGYLVIADLVAISENGKRVGVGTEERLYYYGPDGSGTFAVMRYAGELLFKIIVPDWVKQAKASH
jgi:hypothetical protein